MKLHIHTFRISTVVLAALLLSSTVAYAQNIEKSLINGNSNFALRLYKRIIKERGGVSAHLVSPYSIGSSFSFFACGAKGNTKDSIQRAIINYSHDNQDLIRENYLQIKSNSQIKVNNLLFLDEHLGQCDFAGGENQFGLEIKDYQDITEQRELASLLESEKGRAQLLQKPALLLNINKYKYQIGHAIAGSPGQLLYRGGFEYFQDKSSKTYKLPCQGDICMMILMPHQPEGESIIERWLEKIRPIEPRLNIIQKKLSPKGWTKLMGQEYIKATRPLILPRIDYAFLQHMNASLAASGLSLAFSPPADFRGYDPSGQLRLANYYSYNQLQITPHYSSQLKGPRMVKHIIKEPFVLVMYQQMGNNIVFLGSFDAN